MFSGERKPYVEEVDFVGKVADTSGAESSVDLFPAERRATAIA